MKFEASLILRSLVPALVVASVVFVAAQSFADSKPLPGVTAAADQASTSPEARYQRERARCLSGQSQEDTQTCLKEAGASLQAARQQALTTATADQLAANARKRCE